ncbi:eukaryotic translation elongation factor 1 alpha 1, partial [Reticulomyxa filosa]
MNNSTGIPARFYPTNATDKAFSIEMHHKTVDKAKASGVNVKNLKKENMHTLVMWCALMTLLSQFTALVFVQDHPEQLKESTNDEKGNYKGGFTQSIHVRTDKTSCQMLEIKCKMGK